MIDLVKKSMLMGIGFASLTREKVEEIAQELKKQGSLSEQEGKKFVDEVMQRADTARGDMQHIVETAITKAVDKLDYARKSDIESLTAAVADLTETLKKQQQKEE